MKGWNRWLAALLAASALVRIGAVLALQSHLVPNSTYEHGEIAASLVAGRGFSMHFLGADGPTSQQAPAYPFLVALAYAIGGVEQPRSLLGLELAQSLMGSLMVLGVFRLAQWVVPNRPAVAWVAAVVAAFHPTLIYAATHVQVAALAAMLVPWTLVWGARAGASKSRRDAAVAGVLIGFCALTDPILGLVGLGALLALAISNEERRSLRPAPGLATAMIAATALTITPWVVRNAVVHGEFVPIKSTFGYAFWQGNCTISEGTDKVVRSSVETVMNEAEGSGGLAAYNRTLWKARHTAGYIDDVAFTDEDRRLLGSLPETERSRLLLRRALQDIQNDPARYAGLCLRRLRYFWLFDETNPKTRALTYRASHLALTAAAILGLATAGASTRRRSIPLLATVGAISLFHALTIVSARFHIPIEPLLAVWAGAGVVKIGETLRAVVGRDSERAAGGLEHVGVVGRLG